MSLKTFAAVGPATSVGVAGALVRPADGSPSTLHLSLPRIAMWNRSARRWLRRQVNEQVAAAGNVQVVFHRMRRDGAMTNDREWLAWL